MRIHKSVTADRIAEALEESSGWGSDSPGFCVACGADAWGVEPDAERYECDDCGKPAVYGAEQIALVAY